MFDVEQAIANWRKQMLAAGIKTPVPLEELEIHLREEIERQMKSGLSEQKAFEISVQRTGQPKVLNSEFRKGEGTFMNRTAKISAGIIGLFVGAALLIPGTVQLRDELVMANGRLGLWLFGGVLLCWSAALFQQIFLPKKLKGEFDEVEMTPAKRSVKTGAGIIVLLIGIELLLPAAAQAWQKGLVEFAALGWMVFGIALLITGSLVAFRPYTKRKA
jgi:uncharacterized membrane protein